MRKKNTFYSPNETSEERRLTTLRALPRHSITLVTELGIPLHACTSSRARFTLQGRTRGSRAPATTHANYIYILLTCGSLS